MTCASRAIRRLVLASGSPRRKQLLSLLGLPFVIQSAPVEEEPREGEPPSEMVLRVAQAKAFAATGARPDDLLIAADTTVALDGRSLGKPVDAADAEHMLRELRGRSHTVFTGVVVYRPATRHMVCDLGESDVWMRQYADSEITQYVQSGDPLDKAGAYAIQHPVFDPVARVEGCWLNVMGLPLCHLARALAACGLTAPVLVPTSCRAFSQRDCAFGIQILSPLQGTDASR